MSIRNKVILILVPVMLILIVIINFVFGIFFSNYLEEQEHGQLRSARDNLTAYFRGKATENLGTVNDWGHWDDTYAFLNGDNPDFVASNLTEDTFINLNISFFYILRSDGSLFFSRYYDADSGEFIDSGDTFLSPIQSIVRDTPERGDIFAFDDIGGDYYFIAASDITDSLQKESPNGRLVTGRVIDEAMVSDMEKLAGGTLLSIQTDEPAKDDAQMVTTIAEDKKSLIFECGVDGEFLGGSRLLLTFNIGREFYISGTKEFGKFVLLSVIFSGSLTLVLFSLLGVYLSKPFMRLIREVKNINLKGATSINVGAGGEFKYLETAINGMLERIDDEQKKLKESEEKLSATLLSVGDGVIVVGRDDRVQFLNPIAQKLTGWKQEEALGRPFGEVFRLINEFTRQGVESPVEKVFKTESIIELANHTLLIAKDGTERPIEDTAAPVRNNQGKVASCVLVFRDFSEKKEKQKRIEYLSYHDQLTGLYNRRYFEDEMKRLDMEENLPVSMIYADVNNLKIINDAFGHNSGDELIQHAAEALAEVCGDGLIARTGGDEFIVLLTRTDAHAAEKKIEDIEEKLKAEQIMGVRISLSFGYDTKTSAEQSIHTIMKNAEDAMYHNKIRLNQSKSSTIIRPILTALHTKCPLEGQHSVNVGHLCRQTALALGMTEKEADDIKTAGELHDIGKIAVNALILLKPGPLTKYEWAQVKNHPETGYRLLSTSSDYYSVAEYVLAHHERWDGNGYPRGISGECISRISRIIAVADSYDAMTSERPYRLPFSPRQAAEEIMRNAGSQFDPEIAKVFVEQVLGIEL